MSVAHELHLHPRRCPTDRCPLQHLLDGVRQLAGDDGQKHRPGLAIPVDLSRRGGQLPRRRRNYRLRVPPDIPIKNFWSVVVYDALSRSELQNGQPLASVSLHSKPMINVDGSVDIAFGPEQPGDGQNWIATVSGRGWFPIFRFHSPTEAYFDKTWKLADIVAS